MSYILRYTERTYNMNYNETERNLTKLADYIIVNLRHLTDPLTYEQILTKHNLRYLVPLVLRSTMSAETSTEYLRAWRTVYVNTYTFREYPEPFVIDLRERLAEDIRFTSEDTPHDSALPLINRFYDDRGTYDFRRAVVEALGSDTVAKIDKYLISDIEATRAMLERSPTMFSAVFNGLMSEDFVREYVL